MLGFVVGAVLLFTTHLSNRPNLELWHTAALEEEITAEDIDSFGDFDSYLIQESRLFRQLDRKIYKTLSQLENTGLNRYIQGSWSDPNRHPINWNKTFEMTATSPKAGVLMLHGLSDSPYSMRSLALSLHQRNVWVLGLRLPGHGTAPGGLTTVKWQDFTTAVRLAVSHLREKVGKEAPLYFVGYSNGAALALEYTFSQMLGEDVPKPAGIVLISPAVAVSPTAALAKFNLRLASLPGMDKLAWLSIAQEYDPYKYQSFAVNAGYQIYQLTKRLESQIKQLDKGGKIADFPPVIAFQSVVDSTIPPFAIAEKFMNHLVPGGHELMLFDINRIAADVSLLKNNPQPLLDKLMAATSPFSVSLITNQDVNRRKIENRHKHAMSSAITITHLELEWPRGIYSLSHVALPFRDDDPVYGIPAEKGAASFSLGSIEARGEKEVLQAPLADLMRLRYNPFYTYLEGKTVDWIVRERKH